MEFKRAKRKETATGFHRIYDSRCGCYRLIFSRITLAHGRFETYVDKNDKVRRRNLYYPDQWFAVELHGQREHILSKHTKRAAAERAIRRRSN